VRVQERGKREINGEGDSRSQKQFSCSTYCKVYSAAPATNILFIILAIH